MIRPFILPDLDELIQIECQSFPKSPYDRSTFIHLYYEHSQTFLLYTGDDSGRGEKILGYIIFSRKGHIISIAVLPQFRGRGIGRKMVEEVMKFPEIKRALAEVRKSNQGAQAFYRRLGFQVIGVIPDYYGNEDALVVQWIPATERDKIKERPH